MILTHKIQDLLSCRTNYLSARDLWEIIELDHPEVKLHQVTKACSNLHEIGRLKRTQTKNKNWIIYKYQVRDYD